jgi:pyruvate,water dikinase
MVNADVAGVAFSADPVSGRRRIAVVSAVRGLGESLVAGDVDADTYCVAQNGESFERRLVTPQQPVLNDEQARAVAALARQVERIFGRPQDIEWAMEDGQLYLLQARPITTLAPLIDPDGVYNLWDNSNIVESYGGVTTPLTYSFARRAYEMVYQEFCRIMGVPVVTIAANQPVFGCMIGLIRGRIYYNLLNWYRVLALLPGFKANRPFMEQMMGVKESLPDEIATGLCPLTGGARRRSS